MPYIHMSFIPGHTNNSKRTFDLTEFDGVRDEIVNIIKSAPKKRADNIIVEMQVKKKKKKRRIGWLFWSHKEKNFKVSY